MEGTDPDDIVPDRFYLCDNGDGADAFIVCGQCIIESDRDPSLYDELPELPESVTRTRTCIACGREERSVRSGSEDDEDSPEVVNDA